jgi:uncharacterized protein YndB with AHSA1/START domain
MAQTSSASASVIIAGPPEAVFEAFCSAAAIVQWLPPGEMRCEVYSFEPIVDGRFELAMIYPEAGRGKSSEDRDIVKGRFAELVPDSRIVWKVEFESEDPVFGGEMTLVWTLSLVAEGTLVMVSCDDAPAGISAADHEAGFRETLEKLKRFVERN